MAVVKMKYISLMGRIEDLDRVIETYVTRYPIQLESACAELAGVKGLEPYLELNPYAEELHLAEEYLKEPEAGSDTRFTSDEAANVVRNFHREMQEIWHQKDECERLRIAAEKRKERLLAFWDVDADMSALSQMEFIRCRYGKIPAANVGKLDAMREQEAPFVFYPIKKDEHTVRGMYFTSAKDAKRVDTLFAAMQFERIDMDVEFSGTPQASFREAEEESKRQREAERALEQKAEELLTKEKKNLSAAYRTLHFEETSYRVRRSGAYIKNDCYVLMGWMTAKDADRLEEAIKTDREVTFNVESGNKDKKRKPPTLLRNIFLFRHFEMFVKMYGLPSAGEIDPTPFVSLTYAFLFGMMFGDVGQGLVLLLGGLIVYKVKKMDLAAILSLCGVFSVFFGYMYGSFFGFEDTVVKTHWLSPAHSGDIMRLLLISVGLGAAIILITMIFNIINAVRAHQLGKLLFDTNGVAGIILYSLVALLAAPLVAGMFGVKMGNLLKIDGIVIGVIAAICVLAIWFREPLERWVQREKEILPQSKGMFFLESFFELFEILLSYVTNSISFVRVGAFALSHAGMMSVVHMLAGVSAGKMTSSLPSTILVMVLGNLLVMGLEGLVVGIQVLRLEFYEIFSRFYSGDGVEFQPNTLEK